MSLGNFFQQLFGPSETSNKTSTGTTAGTNYSQSNIFQDPRFQGFLGSYYDQAGQSGPMNQWQLGGLQGLAGATGYMQPGFAASADIAQNGIPGADVNRFYNQNTQNYVDAMQRQFNTQNAIQNSQNAAVAARQGALTGSGAGTQRAQTQMAQHTAQDPIVAKAYWDAQQNAQEMAAKNTGYRTTAAGLAPQFVGAATGAGAAQFGAGNTWWNDPWQRQVALMGGFQPAIGASGQTGNYTGQQAGTQTGVNQQLPSLGGLAAQGLGFFGSMFADGGAVEGFGFGGMPRLPNWMGRPSQSGGQPGGTPFGTNLSAPLGAPMGMPATGNAMPQAQAPNITGAPEAPSLAPPPAPVAAPPLGAPHPVAPAPATPSAPPLGAPMGQPATSMPQPGAFNVPQGANTQTAAVQPQPSLAKNWMNMAQGGAVGAAGDGHISGFADKVMHATRMFKQMKKELGGRVEAQPQGLQPQGYGTGGGPDPYGVGRFAKPDLLSGGRGEDDVWNTTTTPGDAWNTTTTPEAGGSVGSAWGPHYGPTASGGPSNEDDPRFWDDMRSKAIANDPGMSRRPAAPSMWDKIGQFGRENTWGPQARQPQGQGAQKDDFAEFMSNLSKTARAGLGQGQPAMGTRAEGGRIGYDDGGPTFWDTLSDWGGRVGSALTPNLETGMYSGKTTAEGRPSGFQNLMTTLGSVDASKPGFNWAPGAERVLDRRFKEMEAEREGNRLYAELSGKQYLPGAGPGGRPTDLPTFAAQKEAGDLGPIYGKPTPTVQQQTSDTARMQAETERYKAPYEALYRRNEAIEKDPYLLGLKMRLMQKLDNNEQLTEQDFKDLAMLERIPMPGFVGQPGGFSAPKAPTTGPVGSPPSTPPSGPIPGPVANAPAGRSPAAAAAAPGPAGVGTPAPMPVNAPGSTGGLPPAIPQPTPGLSPEKLKGAVVDGVLAKEHDPALAKTNWEALMDIPDNAALVRKTIQNMGKPVTGDWKTDATAFVAAVSQAPPGQLPVPPRVPGVLAPQPGMTRSSVPDREFMAPERRLVPTYNNESESKLIMKNMLFPGNAQALLHSPGRQAAIEEAKLAARHEAEIAPKREIGQQMVRRMDELRTRMIDAGPDVMYWATGPFLGNPDSLLNKGIQALSTQDANAKLGYNMGWEARHLTHQLATRLPQLSGDKGATDRAAENLINGLSDAFKTSDMNAVFKIFNDATNMIQDMSYNKSKDPFEVLEPGTYYPKQWLERYGRRNASAPRGAPSALVQQMEQAKAAERPRTGAAASRDEIPPKAMQDLFKMGVNADGSLNKPIIDFFNETFNKSQPGLAERLLYPDRP